MTDLNQVWLSWLGPLALLLPKLLIIWLSNYSFMSVPDDVYYGNKSCASNLISTVFLVEKVQIIISREHVNNLTCQAHMLSQYL